MLILDYSTMFADSNEGFAIHPDTVYKYTDHQLEVFEKFKQKLLGNEYGFAYEVFKVDYLNQINTALTEVAWAETMVVIGIGGSDLGGRAVKQALARHSHTVYFYGESTDPHQVEDMLHSVNINKTVFNIVSKSGRTTETMAFYFFLKQKIQQISPDWSRHFIFTTDAEDGILQNEDQEYGITTLSIPDNVGGRFSVLTPVGLFPAAKLGVKIDQLLAGASRAIEDFRHAENPMEHPAWQIAWQQFLLHEQGTKTVVIWPYSSRLSEFGRWFRQLWAESLGKDSKGILPVYAIGPADQHSQLQFYMQGTPLSSFLFLRVADNGKYYEIDDDHLPNDLSYLGGVKFGDLLNIEQIATATSLAEAGKPVTQLEIPSLDEFQLGQLFMTFELAVTALGELLEINPFDQPGVEDSKQKIREMLA